MFGRKRIWNSLAAMNRRMDGLREDIRYLKQLESCEHKLTKIEEQTCAVTTHSSQGWNTVSNRPDFVEVCTFCGKVTKRFDTREEFLQAQIDRTKDELRQLKEASREDQEKAQAETDAR